MVQTSILPLLGTCLPHPGFLISQGRTSVLTSLAVLAFFRRTRKVMGSKPCLLHKIIKCNRNNNLAVLYQNVPENVPSDISSLREHSTLFLSPWKTGRYRLKYCLKGPLSPNQPKNPQTASTCQTIELCSNSTDGYSDLGCLLFHMTYGTF